MKNREISDNPFYSFNVFDEGSWNVIGKRIPSYPQIVLKLKACIDPAKLKTAMEKTRERYVLLRIAYKVTADFQGYVDNSKEVKILTQSPFEFIRFGKQSNDYPWVLGCFENMIYFTFIHSLCDGKGAMEMMKTLLYNYLVLCGATLKNCRGVKTDCYDEQELLQENAIIPRETVETKLNPLSEKKVLKGQSILKKYTVKECNLYRVTFDEEKFISEVKRLETTPFSLLVALFARSTSYLTGSEKPFIKFTVAADIRSYIDSHSLKNNILNFAINYDSEIMGKLPLETLVTVFRSILDVKLNKDNVLSAIKACFENSDKWNKISNPRLKGKIIKSICKVLLKEDVMFAFSYVGSVSLPEEMKKYVDDIFMYVKNVISPIMVEAIAYNGKFSLLIADSVNDRAYFNEVLSALNELGCATSVERLGEIPANEFTN